MILIVDDHIINIKIVEIIIKQNNKENTIVPFYNGQTCLDFVKENYANIKLIFMDIQMPGLTGIETTKEIRKYEDENNLFNIPIIAMTAGQNFKEACIGAEMNLYIEKPIRKHEIYEILRYYKLINQQGEKL